MYLKVKEKLIIFILLNITVLTVLTVITTMGGETKEEKSIFSITDYDSCKLHFSQVYTLSKLQFDILWYKYLNEKTQGTFSSDEKQIYIVKGKIHISLEKSHATVLTKTIQRIKKFKKPLDFLKQDTQKFNSFLADKLASLY